MIKKLRKLLLMSFDNNLTYKEQEELKKGCEDFPELVKEKEELSSLMNVLQKRTYSFQQGFSNKIMREIESLSSLTTQNPREYFEAQLILLFRWVAPVGTAAIILFLITVYLTQGSISVNTITGIENLSFNDAITLSFYNY
jgi:hypothetical protein